MPLDISNFSKPQDDIVELPSSVEVSVQVPSPTGVVATDWAGISAAVTQAQAIVAGGGRPVIKFKACPYVNGVLTPYALGPNSIPVVAGVSYRGHVPILSEVTQGAGYLPDGPWVFIGGTVLKGDGTAPGLAANNVAQGSPTGLGATQIAGVEIFGIGFDTFLKGTDIGATNIMGLVWSKVDHLYARNCGWGFSFVNYQHVDFGQLAVCSSSTGCMYFASLLASATLAPGNSNYKALFATTPGGGVGNKVRGIVFEAYDSATNGAMTIGQVGSCQVNTFGRVTISQTATFTNTSSTVAVTDGTQFMIGMPVTFTATGNGFTVGVNYYVLSVAGNNLTLGLSRFATAAIVASGSGTLTTSTVGFHAVEVAANNGGLVDGHFALMDCEGSGGSAYFEYASRLTIANLTASGIVARASGVLANTVYDATIDFDANCFRSAIGGNQNGTYVQFVPVGMRLAGPAAAAVVSLGKNRMLNTSLWPSGWYKTSEPFSYATMAMNNNVAWASRIDIPAGRTITRIGVNVTVIGNAGAVIRLGIYNDNAGLPWTLVVDAGTVAADTTGYKEITISNALPEGTYWLVSVAQNAATTTPTVTAIFPRQIGNPAGISAATGGSSNGFFTNSISGALPGTLATNGQTGNVPSVPILAV